MLLREFSARCVKPPPNLPLEKVEELYSLLNYEVLSAPPRFLRGRLGGG